MFMNELNSIYQPFTSKYEYQLQLSNKQLLRNSLQKHFIDTALLPTIVDCEIATNNWRRKKIYATTVR